MRPLTVERFSPPLRPAWDEFVQRSKNGTFLFLRDYMEYHRDRFTDHSLLVRDNRGAIVALLPANQCGEVLESHGGLTYGGFVVDGCMTTLRMLDVVSSTRDYLRGQAISALRYRAMPHIYHSAPAEEDLYALAREGARIRHRAALAVVDPRAGIDLQERRRRALRKAQAAGLIAQESAALEPYWDLLATVLRDSYNAVPVHSAAEILELQRRFPGNIRLFGGFHGTRMVAGVLIYASRTVARAQYIAASEEGKRFGALDIVFHFLFREVYPEKRYFDLGTSEGLQGVGLNEGVIEFKEGFGARTVAQDTYELSIL